MNTISTKISDLKGLDYITEVATPDLVVEAYGEDIKKEDVGDYVTQVGIASALTKQFEDASETEDVPEKIEEPTEEPTTTPEETPKEPITKPEDEIVVDDTPTTDEVTE